MNNRPEPASPLPWEERDGVHGPAIISADGAYVYREYPYQGGHFARSADDMEYACWAANNAPKLEARIERLEAALREIAGGGDISSTARIFRQVGIWRDVARKALEQ